MPKRGFAQAEAVPAALSRSDWFGTWWGISSAAWLRFMSDPSPAAPFRSISDYFLSCLHGHLKGTASSCRAVARCRNYKSAQSSPDPPGFRLKPYNSSKRSGQLPSGTGLKAMQVKRSAAHPSISACETYSCTEAVVLRPGIGGAPTSTEHTRRFSKTRNGNGSKSP